MKNWTKEFPKKEGWYWVVINDEDPMPAKIAHFSFPWNNQSGMSIHTFFKEQIPITQDIFQKTYKVAYFLPIKEAVPPLKGKEFDMSAAKKSNLITLARASHKAAQAFESAFDKYYNDLKPLVHHRFWEIIGVFFHEIQRCFIENRIIENAADEFFRKALAKDFHNMADGGTFPAYNMEEALRAANQLEGVANKISDILSNVDDDFWGKDHYSDDGLMDLCDALPLAGPQVVISLLDSKFKTFADLKNLVIKDCGKEVFLSINKNRTRNRSFANIILDGELYVGMSLRNKGREFYQSSVCRA